MIVTVMQARMTSTRLPGKVLAPVLGRPMLARQIERVTRARRLGRLIVATSTDPTDDPVAELCAALAVECRRGPLDDVLDRFHRATRDIRPEHVVRLTADCPLADWQVIDAVIERHVETGADYTSNSVERTFPIGLDAEAMRFEALEAAAREATLQPDREHVTRYFYTHPERFRIAQLRQPENLSRLRWTVDLPADLAFVRAVYAALYPARPDFRTPEILAFLQSHPDVEAINAPA